MAVSATVTKVNTRTWAEEGRYRLGGAASAQLGGISTNLSVDVVVSASVDVPRVTRVNLDDCGAGATSASGTTWFTRPMRSASAASSAWCRPARR